MTTIKVKFRASSMMEKAGTVFYQVIHKRLARQIKTDYKLYPYEWDKRESRIIVSTNDNFRRNYLLSVNLKILNDTERLKHIVKELEYSDMSYDSDDIIAMYSTPMPTDGFILFTKDLIRQLRTIGKERTAERYVTVLNSFSRFRNDSDVSLNDVDSNLMISYESFLKHKGLSQNSISFYMRNLRAIYNRAVEKELTIQRHPFKHVYTGIDKTIKRAIPITTLRQIKNIDLSYSPNMELARDLFLFSFYTRGMSFIDMAYLKKSDISGGILAYRRKKTDKKLYIKWESPMQKIVDKYNKTGSIYLLPIITHDGDERQQYKKVAHSVNRCIKEIGKQLNLSISLTMYVARHTWASVARSKCIPLSIISEGMGHDSEKTTQIYLASLDTASIDKANKQIMTSL